MGAEDTILPLAMIILNFMLMLDLDNFNMSRDLRIPLRTKA